jgi:hypothetical protein
MIRHGVKRDDCGQVQPHHRPDDAAQSVPARFWRLAWLIAVALAWGWTRSSVSHQGVGDLVGAANIPVATRIGFMALLLLPIILSFRSLNLLLWLMGASVIVGTVAYVPLMPYIREGVHLVFCVTGLRLIYTLKNEGRALAVREGNGLAQPFFVACLFFCFFCMAIFSVALNWSLSGSIWQLKVGISEAILLGAFGIVFVYLSVFESPSDLLRTIVDGFAWAAIAQIPLSLVAIVLLIITPLVPGSDTVYGLGYWDRMKTTFSGPDHASAFFVASVPLLVWWRTWNKGRIARILSTVYLQLAPWLLMATGSRMGKIAMLFVLGAGLLQATSRRVILQMLPSSLFAFCVGFYFQSFPAALCSFYFKIMKPAVNLMPLLPATWEDAWLAVKPPINEAGVHGLSLKGRFFQDAVRWQLLKETIEAFMAASPLNKLFGFGLGVAGNRLSGFPSPHMTPLDTLIELGGGGLLCLTAFVGSVLAGIWRLMREAEMKKFESVFATFVAVVACSLPAFTWEVHTWGIVMVIYVMAAVLLGNGKRTERST